MLNIGNRGAFAVRRRPEAITALEERNEQRQLNGEEPVEAGPSFEFPVGSDLENAISPLLERMSASQAIRTYAKQNGVDLRDVLDTALQGEEIGSITVNRFLTNTGLKPLFSPVVEDGLRMGMNRVAARYQNLIARTVRIDQMSYEYYQFDNGSGAFAKELELRRVSQGAEVPVAYVTVSGKSYTLFKVGRGIEWTDESKAAPVDLAAMWFQQLGIQIGLDYYADITDKLLNGYFADNSDDPNVIATGSAGVFTDGDLYKAQATLEQTYGYTAAVMLMSLTTSITIRTLESGNGNRLFPNGVEGAGLPPIQIANGVPNDKIVFVDTGFAIVRFVYKDFGTEFDRVPRRGIEGSYGTSIDLVVPLFKDARLVLDA